MVTDKYGCIIRKGSVCKWEDPRGESDPNERYTVCEEPNDEGCYPEDSIIKMESEYGGTTEALPHEVYVVAFDIPLLQGEVDRYIFDLGWSEVLHAVIRTNDDGQDQVYIDAELDGYFIDTFDDVYENDSEDEAKAKIKAWFRDTVKPDLAAFAKKIEGLIA